VTAAYKNLHKRRICHGDVRAANVLVRNDDSVVLVDFERGFLDADRITLLEEEDEVRHMLQIVGAGGRR
jgi:tRNA A-37 threonylcarbamoyl transferase component Bud32